MGAREGGIDTVDNAPSSLRLCRVLLCRSDVLPIGTLLLECAARPFLPELPCQQLSVYHVCLPWRGRIFFLLGYRGTQY